MLSSASWPESLSQSRLLCTSISPNYDWAALDEISPLALLFLFFYHTTTMAAAAAVQRNPFHKIVVRGSSTGLSDCCLDCIAQEPSVGLKCIRFRIIDIESPPLPSFVFIRNVKINVNDVDILLRFGETNLVSCRGLSTCTGSDSGPIPRYNLLVRWLNLCVSFWISTLVATSLIYLAIASADWKIAICRRLPLCNCTRDIDQAFVIKRNGGARLIWWMAGSN